MVQNEINNLGFLTGEGKTKMSKVKMEKLSFSQDSVLMSGILEMKESTSHSSLGLITYLFFPYVSTLWKA